MASKKQLTIDDLRLTKSQDMRSDFVNRAQRAPAKIVNPIVLLAYTLLTALMTWPLVANLTSAIPGDSFDGWQNYWNLWWVKIALVDNLRSPFVTDLLYYPTGVNLYFHTLNPFNGLLTLPLQLSAGLIPAYNAVVFFSWVMGGYGVYLLTGWILGSRYSLLGTHRQLPNLQSPSSIQLSAFLAGLIFTFSPFHMAHLLGHMQVMSLQWIPFYVLYLLRAMEQSGRGQPWLRSALMAGLFLTLTGLCDWYFVLYLFLFTGLVIGWRWMLGIRDWRVEIGECMVTQSPISTLQSLFSYLRPPLIAGLLFLLLLAPILVPMIREATQFSFMVRPTTDLYVFSASLADFFVPNRLHTLFRPESFNWIGNQIAPPSEKTISIGYLPLLLALMAAWKDRRRAAFWLISAVFFLLMALGPRIHIGNITQADVPNAGATNVEWTPYAILNRLIPFMRISRSVSRYALMVQLCMAVAAGLGFAAWLRSRPNNHQSPNLLVSLSSCFLVALLILAEFWVAPYPISPPDTPAFYTQLATMPESGAVLNLPMNYDRPGYLLYQTVHHKPLTVAYISRDDPRTYTERAPVLQHFRHLGADILDIDPARVGMTVLHDLGVGWVVQDRYKMPSGEERIYTETLAKAIFAGQTPLYEDDRLTVQPVQAPDHPIPYVILGELGWGPLQVDAKGIRSRALTDQLAELGFRHFPANSQVQIRYRTPPDVGIQIAQTDSAATLATLLPAPQGNEVTVDLGELSGEFTLALMTEAAEGVQIELIRLVQP